MVVEAARDILDGRRDQTIGGLFRSAGPVVATLIVVGLLAGIAIAIGFVLLIIPGPHPADDLGGRRSRGRDRAHRRLPLVRAAAASSSRGNGWQVFGVLVLLFIGTFVVQVLIAAILGGIFDSLVGFALGVLLANLLMMPLTALAAAVLFFDLKAIKGEPVLRVGSRRGPTEPSGAAAPATAAPSHCRRPGRRWPSGRTDHPGAAAGTRAAGHAGPAGRAGAGLATSPRNPPRRRRPSPRHPPEAVHRPRPRRRARRRRALTTPAPPTTAAPPR